MRHVHGTRGSGLLEGYLAHRRAGMADHLIPETLRSGAVLDIGCGMPPTFLLQTRFTSKYGVDRRCSSPKAGVSIAAHDLAGGTPLPFQSASMDVVTALATFEHLPLSALPSLLRDVRRVLKPGGLVVITTPHPRTHVLLTTLAAIGLLSKEEIDEHAQLLSAATMASLLREAGFERASLRNGVFEWGCNTWFTARNVDHA